MSLEFRMPIRSAIRPALVFVAAAAALSGVAHADGPPSKGERALTYRKALYQVIVWNVGPMGGMAQDKLPFNASEFALRAQRVAELTPMLAEAYPPESQDVANSKLKPAMWANRADFDSKLKTLVERSAALAEVAQGGDPAKTKAAFFSMADACKACHDKYKAD
jgi:cytochrome c556